MRADRGPMGRGEADMVIDKVAEGPRWSRKGTDRAEGPIVYTSMVCILFLPQTTPAFE